MPVILAVANQKGGVGKTTTTLNLGAALVEKGRKVLLVDLDPQGCLTLALGGRADEGGSRALFEQAERPVAVSEVGEGLALVAGGVELAEIESELGSGGQAQREMWRQRLRRVGSKYDYVLLDCPPGLGALSLGGLQVCDGVLIPMQCDYLALRGVALILRVIELVRENQNPRVRVVGIVPTLYDRRTVHSGQVVAAAQERFGELVFNTHIRHSALIKKSPVAASSVLAYAPRSAAAQDYRDLAEEVIAHVEKGKSKRR